MTTQQPDALQLAQECQRQSEEGSYERGLFRHVGAELLRQHTRITELESQLQYEQHRRERIGTHGPGCEAWGPQHYECALRELVTVRAEKAALQAQLEAIGAGGVEPLRKISEQPAAGQEPMFWVRLCSDGLYEGPIHNARIEEVRKQSGAWSPLYLAAPQPAVAAGWMHIETAPKGEKVLLFGKDRKPCIDDWALYCRINQPRFTHWMPLPPAPSTEGESNG